MLRTLHAAFAALVLLLPFAAFADSCIWFSDKGGLSQVRTNSPAIALTVPLPHANALAMNGQDCGVWALDNKSLMRYDVNGDLQTWADLKLIDRKLDGADQLTVDPYDGSVWIADHKKLIHLSNAGVKIGESPLNGPVRAIAIALDQSVWVLGNKVLWQFNTQGILIATIDLHPLVTSAPRQLAIDNLGGRMWLAGEKQLTQINLKQPNQPPLRISLPHHTTAVTVNPLTGEVWLAADRFLLSYSREGNVVSTLDLHAHGVSRVEQFAFDPASRTLWVGSKEALHRFSDRGELVSTMVTKEGPKNLGVPAFMLTPSLHLIRPPQNALTNNPQPTISYGYAATCNDQPCGFEQSHFSGYSITATLNQQLIGPFVFDGITGQASHVPGARLPEGQNKLSAQAKDGFGQVSNTVDDVFTIDTIAPRFLSVSPASGSVVTTPNISLTGVVDDATAVVVLDGVGPATNTSISSAGLAFNFSVTLVAGPNTFKLSAIDKAGNTTTTELHFTLSANVLGVTIVKPSSGATINDDSVQVTGTFEGPINTGITVNDVVATQDGNQFYAHVPLQLGANTLTVTATTPAGAIKTQSIDVVSAGPSPIQVKLDPAGGIAALKVSATVQNNTSFNIVGIDADFNGDGIVDVSATDVALPLEFTYTVPGVYDAKFKITDSEGVVVEKVVTIVVADPAKIDQMLKAQWNGMNNALVRGDKAQALSYLAPQAQTKYGPVFDVLMPDMSSIVASYSPLQAVMLSQGIGEYAVNRMIDGVNMIFFVYFLQGNDGVWRLDSM